METQQAAHPTPRQLAALALDRLTPAARERAQSHVANCPTCTDFLAKTPREALDMLLRQGGSSRSAADQSTPGGQAERGTVAGVGVPLVDAASRRVTSSGGTPLLPAALAPESLPRELSQQTKYRIVRLLGRGGMGSVYEAHHTRMDRQQAIKVINPELVDNPQALLRFEEEIKAVAKLDHPNIARAYDAESFGSLQAIIMEFVPGQTLYEFLKARGRLSVMEACRCVRQALLGLQHAHDRGLVHRDLKPQNLMLARDTGLIKILDFGLAKVVSENRQSSGLTKTHVTMGTYEYMAPEQALDAATAGIRADIYSLGCTLYYLIAGVLPFAYDTDVKLLLAHQNETPRPLREVRPEVPQAVSDLVARMLAKNPADRPQTPAEAAQALFPFAKSEVPIPAAKAADVAAASSRRSREQDAPATMTSVLGLLRRHRLPASLVGLALVGGIIIALGGLFKVRTADGTIALSVSQPDAEVLVDGQTITVNWGPDRKSAEITAPPGKHRLEVKKSGFVVSGKELTIEEGGHEVLSVSLESLAQTVSAPAPVAKSLEENRDFFKRAVPPTGTANSSGTTEPAVAETGFVPLFNGKDLSGWSIDGDDKSGWSVDGGVIFARGVNYWTRDYLNCLLTDREYSDYVLRLEFSLEKGVGAGVAVRAIPGESLPLENGNKVFDHPMIKLIENPAKEQTGTSNWLLDGIHISPDTPAVMQPVGSWNRMELSVQGNRIQVWVNDKLIVNASLPRDKRFPDGTVPGLCRTNGRIGLQKHTGTVRFRNIEVKELPLNSASQDSGAPSGVETADEPKTTEGFRSLFNGKDLTGWKGLEGFWSVKDGAICGEEDNQHPAPQTFLIHKDTFSDFELHYKYKFVTPAGNSGMQFRSNIIDPKISRVGGYQADCDANLGYDGSIYDEGAVAGGRATMSNRGQKTVWDAESQRHNFPLSKDGDALIRLLKKGEWNDVVLVAKGNHVTYSINGHLMTDMTDNSPRALRGGVLAIQLHAGFVMDVRFKDIEIKDLSELGKTSASGGEWKSLFDGKTLRGWRVDGGATWNVAAGAINGDGEGSGTLVSEQEFADFELQTDVKINGAGNSGVFFRITPSASTTLKKYEIQVIGSEMRQAGGYPHTGDLFGFAKVPENYIRDDQWSHLDLVANGNHILAKLDGKTVLDYVDAQNTFTRGSIGLQKAGPPTRVSFRNIRVKELAGAPSSEESMSPAPTDPVQAHTVWTGDHGEKLTILERTADKFKAALLVGNKVELHLSGTVASGRISWQAHDVIAIKGGRGNNCTGTILGDTITFNLSAFGVPTVLRLQNGQSKQDKQRQTEDSKTAAPVAPARQPATESIDPADIRAKVAEKNKNEGAAFLADNKKKEGVKTTPSGLQYKVLKEGKGATPRATDLVTTHYRGTFLDGTEFDSSYRRNQPATFPVKGVIKGWTEALQTMKVGDKWQLFVPSDLAYGPTGSSDGAIPPNATLVFEIELLDTKPMPTADAIQPNSVWRDGNTVLTILERKGDTFRARFDVGDSIVREVNGHVKDDKISWLAKDVTAIKGRPGGDNTGTIHGDTIDFTWHDDRSGKSGEFVLKLKPK